MQSSKDIKENIKDYKKGLDLVREMRVKRYKMKNSPHEYERIGLIAEEAPEDIRAKINGINGIDLYGLVGILINSIKDLSAKIDALEAKNGNSI